MAETDTQFSTFSSQHDSIPIFPPLFDNDDDFYNSSSDQALLGNPISDLFDGEDGDFVLTFENVEDDLLFPSEKDDCVMSTSSCSGNSRSLNLSNQESENYSISWSSPSSEKMVADLKLKVKKEEATTNKRKLESEEDTRNTKYRRSDGDCDNDDCKRNARLIKNRESAQLSRQRKKHYVKELEDKVKNLHFTITDLKSKVSCFMAENATLRHQVGSGRLRHQPPLVPMAYPWMPWPGYMVKPQGSRVPLLPIPQLKPQCSVAKVKKTKKVASVSVLGVLFCLFLFGALASIVSISYKSNYDQSRGRVLDSDQEVGRNVSETENSVLPGSSEPLVASLFVPRNDKLVKIDGNLIIHTVLASEKATAFEMKNGEGKSGVATAKGFSPALPLQALSSSSFDDTLKDKLKSTTANGRMQQWFREGVAGSLFSSGICTEVFQFDVSSNSGAIIPASTSTQQSKNTTVVTHKGKTSRRILRGRLPVSDSNLTKDDNSSNKENFQETKPGPSMVVSVLVNPREGSEGDIDEMMGGMKSFSRIFIVVLVDGVKYVTYSCNLPQRELSINRT